MIKKYFISGIAISLGLLVSCGNFNSQYDSSMHVMYVGGLLQPWATTEFINRSDIIVTGKLIHITRGEASPKATDIGEIEIYEVIKGPSSIKKISIIVPGLNKKPRYGCNEEPYEVDKEGVWFLFYRDDPDGPYLTVPPSNLLHKDMAEMIRWTVNNKLLADLPKVLKSCNGKTRLYALRSLHMELLDMSRERKRQDSFISGMEYTLLRDFLEILDTDGDEAIQGAIMEILQQLKGRSLILSLLEMLLYEENETLQLVAMRVLINLELSNRLIIPILIESLKNNKLSVRLYGFEVLKKLIDTSDLITIYRAEADTNSIRNSVGKIKQWYMENKDYLYFDQSIFRVEIIAKEKKTPINWLTKEIMDKIDLYRMRELEVEIEGYINKEYSQPKFNPGKSRTDH
ncbi:MAG: hypothetical protein WC980_09855 [Candidatus Brocadiia bacterium]